MTTVLLGHGTNLQATAKIVLHKIGRMAVPEETKSQVDEHDETKTAHQTYFHKICVTDHAVVAADARGHERALH